MRPEKHFAPKANDVIGFGREIKRVCALVNTGGVWRLPEQP